MTQVWRRMVLVAAFTSNIFGSAFAAEQRCKDLNANCVCSEPLNTDVYSSKFGYDFNPADTSEKECTKATSQAPGSVVEDTGFRYVAATSGELFSNMPRRSPALKYILRTKTTAEGNAGGGGRFIGHQFGVEGANPSPVRRAWRGYLYFSSDYELYNGTTCVNSTKIIQFGQENLVSAILSGGGGYYNIYGWTGWSTGTLACCIRGPGGNESWGTYDENHIQGKWFRFEVVMTNTAMSGPTTTFKIYMKNVTDNLPEVTIIDSTVPTTQPVEDNWTSVIATTLKPASTDWNQVVFDLFRRDTCKGYKAVTHVMAAAWNTDDEQRIGPAVEVEGNSIPSNPTNLKIQ